MASAQRFPADGVIGNSFRCRVQIPAPLLPAIKQSGARRYYLTDEPIIHTRIALGLVLVVTAMNIGSPTATAISAPETGDTGKYIQNLITDKPQETFPDRTKQVEEAKAYDIRKQAEADAKALADAQAAQAAYEAQVEATQAAGRYASASKSYASVGDNAGNGYDYGQCTYYVKSRRSDIGNFWGDANQWPYSASAAGYSEGSSPHVGAIAVARGGNHVAYVESVNGDMVTISEMNYFGNGGGWNRVSYRTTSSSEFIYIY